MHPTHLISPSLLVLVLASGCGYGAGAGRPPSTRTVYRSAAIAPAVPLTPTATPMDMSDRRAELYFGSSSIRQQGDMDTKGKTDRNSGLYIARFNADGGLRLQVSKNVDVGLVGHYGSTKGAERIGGEEWDPFLGDYFASALRLNWRIGADSPLQFVSGFQLGRAWVPTARLVDCNSCPFERKKEGRSGSSIGGFHASLYYRMSARVLAYAGVSVVGSAMVDQGRYIVGRSDEPKAIYSTTAVVMAAGIRGQLVDGLDFIAGAQQTSAEFESPVALTANLALRLGSRPSKRTKSEAPGARF